MVLVEYFENIYITLLRCTTIETFGRKYRTIIITRSFKDIESQAPQSTGFRISKTVGFVFYSFHIKMSAAKMLGYYKV